jgi:hypothetical protein
LEIFERGCPLKFFFISNLFQALVYLILGLLLIPI